MHSNRPATLYMWLVVVTLATSVAAAQRIQANDLHALVRQAIQADVAIQAVRPPTVVYVWFEATPDGRIVASGRDTSRVTLLKHARALGTIKEDGFAPAGVLASAKVVYAWVNVPTRR